MALLWGAASGLLPVGAWTAGTALAATTNPGGASAPGGSSAPSSMHVKTVRITSVRCVPVSKCGTNPHEVTVRGTLVIAGKGLESGLTVAFPKTPKARIASNSPAAHLRKTPGGLEVTVPAKAHSGNIMVLLGGGRHTSSYGPITLVKYALHPPAPKDPPAAPVAAAPGGSPFEGQGMWIWYLSSSSGGSVASIASQAHAADVSTVFVKSSDGSTNYWSQFSPELVAQLHASGLKVCAWQYVYGTNPAGEAELGAKAAASGAECLVIDAESQYEGRYGAAQTYIDDLRAKVGPTYPLGLASFPYVYYHTSFPYSVFLGPNGAQFNAPQMYWKDIGNSVDTVYANTYIANRVYGRPIYPLGQTYSHPSNEELLRFREEAVDYGATGLSWWDWQETPASEWTALAAPQAPLTTVVPNPGYTELSQGSKGDPVLWMQEHLATAIPTQATTGIFDATTTANLEQFQTAHGLPPTGKTEAATWQALLALAPVAVNWTGSGPASG
ncbi:MAG TPA: peptidoglycan-binding domain-containing protein [Solirubrobacteraceae bacterium]|nr:peptidoglycan-binding domain-containing protein [Solirubrobacteraceae bacterium]